MSVITDLVIFSTHDEDAMDRVNAWCVEHDHRQHQFAKLDTDAAGGGKVFTDDVWAMAGNYFPHEDLVEALPSFGWRYPQNVVLIVDHEHDDEVRVYRVKNTPPDPTACPPDCHLQDVRHAHGVRLYEPKP